LKDFVEFKTTEDTITGSKAEVKIANKSIASPGFKPVQRVANTDDKMKRGGYCQTLNARDEKGANETGILSLKRKREVIVPKDAGSPGGDHFINSPIKLKNTIEKPRKKSSIR